MSELRRRAFALLLCLSLPFFAACPGGDGPADGGGDGHGDGDGDGGTPGFVLTSTAFDDGGALPVRFTCQAENDSPPLAWEGAPAGTAGFGLVFVDLSIDLIHSVLWDVPGDRTSLPEGVPEGYTVDDLGGAHQTVGYDGQTRAWLGPCPPNEHTYRFELIAVSERPLADVGESSTRAEVQAALEGASLGKATLTVTFDPG